MNVKWTRIKPRLWRGDTGGLGSIKIQAARPDTKRAMRFYLMTDPWLGDAMVIGDYDSLLDAQRAAEKIYSNR